MLGLDPTNWSKSDGTWGTKSPKSEKDRQENTLK